MPVRCCDVKKPYEIVALRSRFIKHWLRRSKVASVRLPLAKVVRGKFVSRGVLCRTMTCSAIVLRAGKTIGASRSSWTLGKEKMSGSTASLASEISALRAHASDKSVVQQFRPKAERQLNWLILACDAAFLVASFQSQRRAMAAHTAGRAECSTPDDDSKRVEQWPSHGCYSKGGGLSSPSTSVRPELERTSHEELNPRPNRQCQCRVFRAGRVEEILPNVSGSWPAVRAPCGREADGRMLALSSWNLLIPSGSLVGSKAFGPFVLSFELHKWRSLRRCRTE